MFRLPGPLGDFQDWLTGAKAQVNTVSRASSQASVNRTNPPPFKRKPIAQPSEGLRKLFNDSNWKVPDVQKSVGMPEKSFDLGQSQALQAHTYSLEQPEWKRLQEYYASENAKAWGWAPPAEDELTKLLAAERATALSGGAVFNEDGVKLEGEAVTKELERREAAIQNAKMPKINAESYTAAPLTWEAYNALPSEQKTAVDWNTLLIAAREKDLSNAAFPKSLTPEAQAEYDEKFKKIFGDFGGSDVHAENTLTLLDNLGITAKGQDLDEYLGLDRAVSSTELPEFKFTPGQVQMIDNLVSGVELDKEQVTRFAEVRAPENLRVLDAETIETAGAKIKQMLTDPSLGLWSFEAAVPGLVGARKRWSSEEVPMGFGSPELRGGGTENVVNYMESWMQDAYEHLKSKQGDPEDIWNSMTEKQFTKEDTKTFFDYMDTRLRNEEQYGEPPVTSTTGATRTAKEIRRILGMEE